MKRILRTRAISASVLLVVLLLFFLQCKTTNVPSSSRNSNSHPKDMVLIYTGGSHRPAGWWKSEHFAPYVSLEQDNSTRDWLFDGFLFLEIRDGEWSFFGRHGKRPARQKEWKSFVDKLFTTNTNIIALNDQINKVKNFQNDGDFEKRKIIIAIPEPKEGQKDWGELQERMLDFSLIEDQIQACKWYVDYVLEKYEETSPLLQNVELNAFYWIKENNPLDARITQEVSSYVREKGYSLYWIPNMLGLGQIENDWEMPGYDWAYLQPGYFYRTDKDSVRLRESSELIDKFNLNPYVEFDERTLLKKRNWGYRLHKTIDVFEEYDFWNTKQIGYYQGFNGLYQLYESSEAEDNKLYLRLADIIAQRQKSN